jgi:hypothetical protein
LFENNKLTYFLQQDKMQGEKGYRKLIEKSKFKRIQDTYSDDEYLSYLDECEEKEENLLKYTEKIIERIELRKLENDGKSFLEIRKEKLDKAKDEPEVFNRCHS